MSPVDWRSAGTGLAPLDDITVLLLIGDAPVPLAAVARGAASVANDRRVAVFDLAGAFGSDDADGILAALRDGRSLNALARPLDDGSGERFIVPRGPGELDALVVTNERWAKLVEGFRASGAVLILVVPTSCEEIGTFVALADRACRLTSRSGVPGLEAWVTKSSVPPAAPPESPPLAPPESAVALDGTPDASVPRTTPPRVRRVSPTSSFIVPPAAPRRRRTGRRRIIALVMVIIVVGIAASAWTRWGRSARQTPPTIDRRSASLAAIDSSASGAQDTVALPTVVDPGDSVAAAQWGVELVATNDRTDANFRLARTSRLPAGTLSPVVLGGDSSPWYKIVAGAFIDRTAAELLRATLRQAGALEKGAGVVARVPLALRLDTALTPDTAKARVSAYVARGIGAYALVGDDGMATVYAGAFATADQAVLLFAELRKAGFDPALSFRVGRTY